MTPEQRVKIASDAMSIYIEQAFKRHLTLPSTDTFTNSVQQALLINEECFAQAELAIAYEAYIKLLHERLSQLEPFAANHHMLCPIEMVERGEKCRIKIAELKIPFEKSTVQ